MKNKTNDYDKFLKEIGATKKEMDFLVNMGNVKETSSDIYHKSNSKIHGIGVFASKNIKKGKIIGDVSINGKYRTTLGRWVNHSKDNNIIFSYKEDNVNMIATSINDIKAGEEIVTNYRHHVSNNKMFLSAIRVLKLMIK
tara:strand:+ start:233 stop:652 length:420 start_codon:yes stop_codon:yes gene_type:complete